MCVCLKKPGRFRRPAGHFYNCRGSGGRLAEFQGLPGVPEVGNTWFDERKTPVLKVPSAVYLLLQLCIEHNP
jgi:hypothetical protein